MIVLKRLLREPILHFLVAGAVLYGVAVFVRGPELMPADDDTIVVDRQKLLSFLQFRANAFDPDVFADALDAMPEQELEQLIDAFVDEEVLFREADALALDDSDYIIRQRMVQKMQFLLGDLAGDDAVVDQQVLQSYFENNKDTYWVPASAIFTHVFFDASRRGDDGAEELARQTLQKLNDSPVEFNEAVKHGDRFVFLRNYVERTVDFVRGHFGKDFAQQLSQLTPSTDQWQGPLQSAYGFHLVLLTDFNAGHVPSLSDVRDQVERDLISERNRQALQEITRSIRERYTVEIKVNGERVNSE